jgi:hypothetical protein
LPSFTCSMTAGFTALRSLSSVIVPVMPMKSLVDAIASRIFAPSVELARLMASNRRLAAS